MEAATRPDGSSEGGPAVILGGTPAGTGRATGAKRFVVSIMVVIATVLSACGSASKPSAARPIGNQTALVIPTVDGTVHGKTTGATDEYLGIPYAAPPVGPLRWRPPQPVTRWSGVREATQFAPHCAQPASSFGVASMAEDCLYLNVFAPAGVAPAGRNLPVMVWLHGGALIWGESDDYDPTALVSQGVMVVTVNYRLGALGFLAHPALGSGPTGATGNYGLMDQQAALHWVQQNISAFGGNPANVTLFGESAGGLSVLTQLASPGARGLFSRAIVESGTYAPTTTPLATADAAGEAFAESAGCASQSAGCLRSLPVPTILQHENPAGYKPDIDGQVVVESLGTALATGAFDRVAVIDGTNHDERRLFVALYQLSGDVVTAANYRSMISSLLGVSVTTSAAVAGQYPLSGYPSAALALSAAWTDGSFSCPALTIDRSLSQYVRTYADEFSDENAPERYLRPVDFSYGAAHESEIQYLFTLQNAPLPGVLSPPQERLASTMRKYWTNFAKQGSPGDPAWPRFDSSGSQVLSLIPTGPRIETDLADEHHCAFWANP